VFSDIIGVFSERLSKIGVFSDIIGVFSERLSKIGVFSDIIGVFFLLSFGVFLYFFR
jgi:hypothetical protein